MKAHIVLGLTWGDEGKGVVTDFLSSLHLKSVVVRFSGGQQAGHTVTIGERKHVFSNFGSGTLRNVPTYWSQYCTFFLNTLAIEAEVLDGYIDDKPIITMHPLAKMTTPYDVAFGRIREKKLNHGSVGLGVGATYMREKAGYKLYAVDLQNTQLLKEKLRNVDMYYRKQLSGEDLVDYLAYVDAMLPTFEDLISFGWINYIVINNYNYLTAFKHVIFEGSQGIMLDKDHGTFPHVTYGNTTSKNALKICKKIGAEKVDIYHVTRCYQTRHGNGGMTNGTPVVLINNESETNVHNEWQKEFRVAEFDYNLINQAARYDDIYSTQYAGQVRHNLVITCTDQRPDWVFDRNQVNCYYDKIFNNNSPESITMDIYAKKGIVSILPGM